MPEILGADLRRYMNISRSVNIRGRDVVLLVTLNLVATVFEGFGLGALLPLIEVVTQGEGAPKSSVGISQLLDRLLGFVQLRASLESLTVLVVVLIVLRQIFVFLRQAVSTEIQERAKDTQRQALFDRWMHADFTYHDRATSGQIINSLSSEIQIGNLALFAPIAAINLVIIGLVYLALMVWVSPAMTMVSLGTLIVAALLLQRIIATTRRAGEELAMTNRQIVDFLVGRVGSLRLLRLCGTENAETRRMNDLSRRIYHINTRVGYLSSSLNVLMEPIVLAAGLGILYFGVRSLGMSAAEIGFFVLVVLRLQPVSKDLLKLQQQFVTGWPSLAMLDDRMSEMLLARENRDGTRPMPPLETAIRFHHVNFVYSAQSESVPALRDIDVVIPARRMTALVGPSGAGKSTLVDLLPRLRIPTSGQITIDGEALDAIDVGMLRASIAFVPQSPRILGGTPLEHICYGNSRATASDIEAAARLAGAHDFIAALRDGYNTPLGDEGKLLSGGERQRLDLARALLRHAPVLLLDEPTSNLDAVSERRLQEALARLRAEERTTIIMIAHRLATIASADQIVVLNGGRVEAVGHHQDLSVRSAWYADACARQFVGGPIVPAKDAVRTSVDLKSQPE